MILRVYIVFFLCMQITQSEELFFPYLSLGDGSQLFHNRLARNYSKYLKDFDEKSLSLNSKEAFRLCWFKSYDQSIVIRINKKDKGASITYKESVGKSTENLEKTKIIKHFDVSEKDYKKFLVTLEEHLIWGMKKFYNGGAGGSRVLIEGSFNNSYHAIDRWSPFKHPTFPNSDDFQSVVKLFFELANVTLTDEYLDPPHLKEVVEY